MTPFVLGLLLFLGVHSVSIVAPSARDRWAAALGANAWRGLYSVVSLVGFVLMLRGYGVVRHSTPILYVAPGWLHSVTLLLMLPVFPLLVASNLPGRIRSAVGHPMLAAVTLWSFAHLLANGSLADVLLFGGFLAWSAIDRLSFRWRVERPLRLAPPGRWNDLVAVVVGLALYVAVLLWLHQWAIGVAPR